MAMGIEHGNGGIEGAATAEYLMILEFCMNTALPSGWGKGSAPQCADTKVRV